jgi:hypothetical protein
METKFMKPEYAMFYSAFPCNPKPFLNRMGELIEGDYANMKSPDVLACLFVLNAMAYGQLANIDMNSEWVRLKAELIPENVDMP